MTKKLLALALAALLTLSAASVAAAEDVTRITMWHSMSDTAGQLMDKYVKQFNETIGADKGVQVELVFQGTYADATTKMNNMLGAKQFDTLPDIMQLDATGKLNYYASGVAYTIDDALEDDPAFDISQLLEGAMGNWNFAGVQLGVPFATSTTIMFYNKTLLDGAGVKAPETFADIITMAAALPKTTEDGAEIVPYAAVPNTPTLANWLGQLGSYVVNNSNGSEAAATQLECVENGALETFLAEWKAMYAAGALKNVSGSSDSFVAGQLAIYTTSSSNVTTLLSKIGGAFEMGVAYYPKVNADASFGATVSGSCLVMFNKGDDSKKAATRELMAYLTSAEVQADFAVGTGYIPANKAAVDEDIYRQLIAEYPQYTVGPAQLAVTPAVMRSVTVGPSKDFYYAIEDGVAAMLDDDLDIEEAVELISDELNGLLYQYNQANQ